jgi:ribosomal protein S18 acetylase RimI-like enzyme
MNLEYRSATPADARDCIRLRGLTRENAISEDWLASVGITTESWAKDIQDGASPGFVCVAEDEMAGYCFGSSKTGEVLVLAMHPNYENRGIGRELLRLVIACLQEQGHERLFLGCSPDPSVRSYGFYRHVGWSSTGTFDENGDEVLEYRHHAGPHRGA